MKQTLEQQQTQRQMQTARAMQVLLSSLLEMPITDLAQRVERELLDNPALEADSEADEAFAEPTTPDADALDDYRVEDDIPEDILQRRRDDEDRRQRQIVATESMLDGIYAQVAELGLSPREEAVMRYLIGSLDAHGFIDRDTATIVDELAFSEYIDTDEATVERLLGLLHHFDPIGLGTRDVRDCLLVQLDSLPPSPEVATARRIIADHYDAFLHQQWDAIATLMAIDADAFARATAIIRRLNPRPANGLGGSGPVQTLVPDFTLSAEDGRIDIQQNTRAIPAIRLSTAYTDLVAQEPRGDKAARDAYTIARDKVQAAQTFIEGLRRRQSTLQRIMTAIVRRQRDFFLSGDNDDLIQPLTLREVAETAEVDVSTVSRAVGTKYVQTPYGIYPLRRFFESSFTAADGTTVAARKAKAALKALVAAEDPHHPMNDDALAAALKAQGYTLSRRTVAKYRGLLGIPPSTLRSHQ